MSGGSVEDIKAYLLDGAPMQDSNSRFVDGNHASGYNSEQNIPETSIAHETHVKLSDHCRKAFQQCAGVIDYLAPRLDELMIPAQVSDEFTNYLRKIPDNSQNMNENELISDLEKVCQLLITTLKHCHKECNNDNSKNAEEMTQKSVETFDENVFVSVPFDNNERFLSQDIQPIVPIAMKTIDGLNKITLSPSKLLKKSRKAAEILTALEIIEQPKELWKRRTMKCFKNNTCPAIQGQKGQRSYIKIKWSEPIVSALNNLFCLVELLSYDGHPHPCNVLVPPKTKFRNSKTKRSRPSLNDLIIDETYGFDKHSKTILYPISKDCCRTKVLSLQLFMFSLYKTNDETDSSDENIEGTTGAEIGSIEDQFSKLSKIRMCLCQEANDGNLEYLSNSVTTEFIEESKSTKPLSIDPEQLTPKILCKCGRETIIAKLNTDSEKRGFIIRMNGEKLSPNKVIGVHQKEIRFQSKPSDRYGDDFLEIQISRESVGAIIKQRHHPLEKIDELILLSVRLPYVDYSQNLHDHIITPTNE